MTVADLPSTRLDRFAAALRGRVRGGFYAPGQRLTEAALCAEFGLGRGLVREAFRRLAAEGLLDATPHRGVSVRAASAAAILAAAPLREVLEGLAARLAAGKGAAARQALMAALAAQRAAETAADPAQAFASADAAFHALLVDLGGNPGLEATLRPLAPSLTAAQNSALFDAEARQAALADHARLVAAVVMGEAVGAEGAARAHRRREDARLAALLAL